ncbi:MAG TPA: tail fiber domain-containing protein [Bacteroidia bacterium]|nr:tail fiber domain-containing protein [Bacteroidia bacterium]HRC32186.1 tail fiber domain-containing protein [Bacteroidia bacterium]
MTKKTLLVLAIAIGCLHNDGSAQSWSLTGNTGTSASTNFIGTKDAVTFKIRTNNITRVFVNASGTVAIGNSAPRYPFDVKVGSINTDSLYRIGGNRALYSTLNTNLMVGNAGTLGISGSGNTLVGEGAGTSITTQSNNTFVGRSVGGICTSNNNTVMGRSAAYTLSTGVNNCYFGMNSGYNANTGSANVAMGAYTLYFNSGKSGLVAIGDSALFNNSIGGGAQAYLSSDNTAVGQKALFSNNSGFLNTAIGSNALRNNTSGFSNTAVGVYAMAGCNTGFYNTVSGYSAFQSLTTGSRNVSLGYFTGISITTGTNNSYVGTYATGSFSTITNSSAFGYDASVDASNKVRVGNTSVSSIGGQVGFTNFSDARVKNNIQSNVPGLAFIKLLNPVTYHFDIRKENELMGITEKDDWEGKYDIEKIQFTGFLAQDVDAAAAKINYDFSGVDKSGKLLGLRYSEFVVPIVKSVQELSTQNEMLQAQINKQQIQLDEMRNMIATMKGDNNLLNNTQGQWMKQNEPNPFNQTSTINFNIDAKVSSATIVISAANGDVIKTVNVNTTGSLQLNASEFAAGQYFYTLMVDGKAVEKKSFTVAH